MRPTSLTRLHIRDVPMGALASRYAEWVLGTGEFRALRTKRLALGVPADVEADAVVVGGDFAGGTIQARFHEGAWTLHWRHGDDRALRDWHNVVRLLPDGQRVRIEHLCGFIEAEQTPLSPNATQMTRWLIEHHRPRLSPAGLLGATVMPISAAQVDGFVAHVLLDPAREVPVIIASTDEQGALVDVAALARHLLGTAQVVRLADREAGAALWRAFDVRGYSTKLGCHGGAVRLYHPGLSREQSDPYDYPLWSPLRLDAMQERTRAERLAADVCLALTRDLRPDEWLGAIVQIDIAIQRARADRLVEATLAEAPSQTVEALRRAVEERDQQIAALKQELDDTTTLFTTASDELVAAGQRIASLTRERDRAIQERDQGIDALEEAAKTAERAGEVASLKDALRLASRALKSSLVVLPSAWRSIEACEFRNHDLLFRVLSLLALSQGGRAMHLGDLLLATVGNQARWKPKDSPQTMSKFGTDRDFTCGDGGVVRFEHHITLGHGTKAGANMQLYFRAIEGGIVEVGWAGVHLRTVSHDT